MPRRPHTSDEGTDGSKDRLERNRRRRGTVTNQRGVNLEKKRLEETPFRTLKLAQSVFLCSTRPGWGMRQGQRRLSRDHIRGG